MALGDTDSIIPHVMSTIHVDCHLPVLGLDVVPLRLLELALALKLLCKVQVRLPEEILAMLLDQSTRD